MPNALRIKRSLFTHISGIVHFEIASFYYVLLIPYPYSVFSLFVFPSGSIEILKLGADVNIVTEAGTALIAALR